MGFNGSGGGISNASDVALNSPGNGQVLAYETASAKWRNVTASATSGLSYIYLDQMSGNSDDDKLTAAIALINQ